MLSTAAELVPRSKRPPGAQGWCAGPVVEAEMNAAWQQREEARRHLRAKPHSSNLQKAVKMARKKLRKVRKGCRAELLLGLSPKYSKHALEMATRPAFRSTLRR